MYSLKGGTLRLSRYFLLAMLIGASFISAQEQPADSARSERPRFSMTPT